VCCSVCGVCCCVCGVRAVYNRVDGSLPLCVPYRVKGVVLSIMQCVAACCSVLQCSTVCCSVWQYIAVWPLSCKGSHAIRYAAWCSVLHYVIVCCSVLQCVAVCCSVLQCVASCHSVALVLWTESRYPLCSVLQCVAVCCSVLQCVAVYCSVALVLWTESRYVLSPMNHVSINLMDGVFITS